MRGHPTKTKVKWEGRDPENGRKLWEVSEELTDVKYGLPEPVEA